MTSTRRVVAIGGGHGLAATLEAARRYADHVTAIVSVADDGGSSGRLREAYGLPAPGDLRRCLVALADPAKQPTWGRAFEHRFLGGELDGHAAGNLVLAALTAVTGDFVKALDAAAEVLGVTQTGRVLPATTEAVVLKAEAATGDVEGQVAVQNTPRISAVSLVPPDPTPPPDAIEAIAHADQVILGPGSLFTSVLAATAVPAIRAAIGATPARKIYVANLRQQIPETDGYDVAAHVGALHAHRVFPDVVLYDPDALPLGHLDPGIDAYPARVSGRSGHDPVALASALAALIG